MTNATMLLPEIAETIRSIYRRALEQARQTEEQKKQADEIFRQAEQIRELAQQNFLKEKIKLDNTVSSLKISALDAQLLKKWGRIKYKDVDKEEILKQNRLYSCESCVQQANSQLYILRKLGEPQKYSQFLKSILNIIISAGGGFASILYLLIAFLAFGIPVVMGSAVFALLITFLFFIFGGSVQFESIFFSCVVIGALFIGGGIIIGFLETQKDSRENAPKTEIQQGVEAYLSFNQAKSELSYCYGKAIKELETQKQKEIDRANQLLRTMPMGNEEIGTSISNPTLFRQNCIEKIEQAREKWKKELQHELEQVLAALSSYPAMERWDSPVWRNNPTPCLQPLQKGAKISAGMVRIGQLQYPFESTAPLLVDLVQRGHIVIRTTPETEQQGIQMLQSVVSHLVFSNPVLSTKFVFIDPRAAGTFSLYSRLPGQMGDEYASSEEQIQEQMNACEAYMKQVQGKLGKSDFQTHNQTAILPEMYRVICISSFQRFSQATFGQLINLLEHGPKAGIHIVAHITVPDGTFYRETSKTSSLIAWPPQNTRQAAQFPGYSQELEQILLNQALLIPEENKWKLVEGEKTFIFSPAGEPDAPTFENLFSQLKNIAAESASPKIEFSKIAPPPEHWWKKSSRPLLEVPFGFSGNQNLLFRLGSTDLDNFIHALVAGRIRAGKSTLFHTLINQIALHYSPDEVELYLLDFKRVEFAPYADYGLPHAAVIATLSEPEFGFSILKKLRQEWDRRSAMEMRKFEDFHKKSGERLPRIVVIMDEYQVLLDDPQFSDKANGCLDDLIRLSGAFGFHFILGSQSKVYAVDKDTYDQMATRVLLPASENLSMQILGVDRSQDLLHSGQVIYNEKQGVGADKDPVGQVASISNEDIIENLKMLKRFADEKGYQRQEPTLVFRGEQPAKFSENTQAIQLYQRRQWLSPQEMKQALGQQDWTTADCPGLAWLGKSLDIDNPDSAAIFRRRNGANLLMIGSQGYPVVGMLAGSLLSLPLFYRPTAVRFLIADMTRDENLSAVFTQFKGSFKNYQVELVQKDKEAAQLIEHVYNSLMERKEQDDHANPPSIFLVLVGIHRISHLKPILESYGTQQSPLAGKLLEILEAGPELGIHTIAWADRATSFDAILGRPALNHITQRVALHLDEAQSMYIFNELTASGLSTDEKTMRAILYDADAEPPCQKFKPYILPNPTDAEKAYANFLARMEHFGRILNERTI